MEPGGAGVVRITYLGCGEGIDDGAAAAYTYVNCVSD
jgi:hypothetical protein